MTRTDGSLITAVPTTDFGYWLRDRCLERKWETYRQVAEYTEVSHSQIRSYVVEGAHPRPPTTRRLAKALRFDEREMFRIVALSEVVAGGQQASAHGAIVHDPNGPATVSDVGDIRNTTKATSGDVSGRTAEAFGKVAVAFATGARTPEVQSYLDAFQRAVDAWHDARAGEGHVPGGGGPARASDEGEPRR